MRKEEAMGLKNGLEGFMGGGWREETEERNDVKNKRKTTLKAIINHTVTYSPRIIYSTYKSMCIHKNI